MSEHEEEARVPLFVAILGLVGSTVKTGSIIAGWSVLVTCLAHLGLRLVLGREVFELAPGVMCGVTVLYICLRLVVIGLRVVLAP